MRRIILLAAKDLKRSFRDRSALAITIGAPLGLAAILSFLLGGVTDTQTFHVTFAVADQDRGTISAGFVDGVLGGMEKAGFAEIQRVESPQRARRLAEDAKSWRRHSWTAWHARSTSSSGGSGPSPSSRTRWSVARCRRG